MDSSNSTWLNLPENTHKFDLDSEYRIVLKDSNELDEDVYTVIYINSCTHYELYFNAATDQHVYGCVNINNISQYEHRLKGQRDQKINSRKIAVHSVQIATNNRHKWHTFHGKYFNINHDYRLSIAEPDSSMSEKAAKFVIAGYVREHSNLENKGFYDIVSVITRYYKNCGKDSITNMEQIVKRELYFTPSTSHHWYGCIKSETPKHWMYRYQGNCVKCVNDIPQRCYKIKCRAQENEYEILDENIKEFDLNQQYRIRLISNGGYIVVERVTKEALYFGVSISRFWSGCVRIGDLHSWHYVDKANKLERIGKGDYSVFCVEFKQ